jgi:predicted glycoside hydrolase/deacetylase ChbG (UPF0249 family)
VRQLAVCVDDFGLHDGVNQAVLDLLALHRISAVSCLVDGPSWARGAAALRAAVGPADAPVADVGLHLNFTEMLDEAVHTTHPEHTPTDRTSPHRQQVRAIGALIKACYLRQLHVPDLVREIERQWDRFETVWGRAPDFIDGHQHAHQLPQIRDALVQVLRRRCPPGSACRPWVRQCRSPGWRGGLAGVGLVDTLKAALIGALGAGALGRQVAALGLPHSQRLLGVYPFDADAPGYAARWQTWLKLVQRRGDLLMCHPAAPMPSAPPWPDVIAASRQMEHTWLCSEAFGRRLQDAGVRIVRLGAAWGAGPEA